MRIAWIRFNIILVVLGLVALLSGCSTTNDTKTLSTLRVHLEVNRDATDRNKGVPIYREKPFMVNVDNTPFLTEANVSEAKVIDTVGGYALQIQFERRGTWLLESVSTANKGKRFAIFSQWPNPADKKNPLSRWLAAPVISQRIADGMLVFTPDASREECSQIAAGLNKLAKKLEDKRWSW